MALCDRVRSERKRVPTSNLPHGCSHACMTSLGYNCFILQSREVLEKLNSDSKLVVGLNVRMAVCICYSFGRVATFQDLPTSHPMTAVIDSCPLCNSALKVGGMANMYIKGVCVCVWAEVCVLF